MTEGKRNARLALAALGVVFGDIGTSPLYTFETAVQAAGTATHEVVLGTASLIFWSLILIVTVKYVGVVMRADYRGEGGVFALLALLQRQSGSNVTSLKLPLYAIVLLFGAALLYGDGTITPAISVLSALEGLEQVNPKLEPFAVPVTVAVLFALFAVQRFGTGRLGKVFGWVMLVWFAVLAAIGLYWVVRCPEVLWAADPRHALALVFRDPGKTLFLMGAVVLAVTGVEALYADMGHFSRKSISLAWHAVALPALVLSYFGQAALALVDPAAIAGGNPFFNMVPGGWPAMLLVILATAATVIASQALISGVFSLTAQAIEMGYMPRLQVMHTSREERGQVYVPVMNWLLAFACILLVLVFRNSSNLAAAYGLAVVATMVITTLMIGRVAEKCWGWKPWQGHALSAAFLVIEIPFLIACLTKLPEGGYFPLIVAGLLLAVMLTWRRGRALVFHQILSAGRTIADLSAEICKPTAPCLPGQLVFITTRRDTRHAVSRAFELMRRGGALREEVIILSLISAMESDVDMPESVRVEPCGERLWHVVARHGFMQAPHAPDVLARASDLSEGAISPPNNQTFYVLPRELIVEHIGNKMPHWQRALFGFLGRNVSYAPDYLFIPHKQILEFTWMLKA